MNYIEENRPESGPFNAFLKATSSLLGSGTTVELPPAEATVFHFEPELALVIGKRASRIKAEEAMEYIFGYTHFMDVSARGLPGGFFLGKSWHTGGPLGPALVTADEIADPNQLNVKLWVNDDQRHDFSTALMARHVSPSYWPKSPGSWPWNPAMSSPPAPITKGWPPSRTVTQCVVQIEGLGPALSVNVHDPLKRSW